MKKSFTKFYFGINLLIVFILICLCFRPVYGMDSYRQAQTNWPILNWIKGGFSPLNPEIPIRGENHLTWLLELPAFQWIVYVISEFSGLRVDYASRLAALCLALLCLRIFHQTIQEISYAPNKWILIFCFNPYFIYWSTTGLIDWLAFYLGLQAAYTYSKFDRNTKLRTFFSFTFLLIALLVKLPLGISGFLLLIALRIFLMNSLGHSLKFCLKRFTSKTMIASIFITFALTYSWQIWLRSLYPPGDPRNVWLVTSQTRYWYFGTSEQYQSVLNNLFFVLFRLVSDSAGPILGIVILILLAYVFIKRPSFMILFIPTFFYVAIFINLNLMHNYYQIPLYFSVLLFLILYSEDIKVRMPDILKLKKYLSTFLLAVLVFLSLSLSYNAKSYIYSAMFAREKNENCYPEILKKRVIYLGAVNPSLFYACNVTSLQVDLNSSDDLELLSQESSHYRYLVIDSSVDFERIPEIFSNAGIKKFQFMRGSLYKIN